MKGKDRVAQSTVEINWVDYVRMVKRKVEKGRLRNRTLGYGWIK